MKTIQQFVEHIRQHAYYLSASIPELKKKGAKITIHEINRSILGPTVDDLAQDLMVEEQSGMVEVEFENLLTVTISGVSYKITVITTAFYWITVTGSAGDYWTPGFSNYEEHLQKEEFTNIIEDVTP